MLDEQTIETAVRAHYQNGESHGRDLDIINMQIEDDGAFVVYDTKIDDERRRIAETVKIHEGKVSDVDRYCGWQLPHEQGLKHILFHGQFLRTPTHFER